MQIGRLKSEWMFSLVHKCICAIWEVAPDSHLCLVVYVFFHVWPFIEFIITSYSCPFNLFKAFWIFGITHLNCRAQHLCKIMFFVSKLTPVLSVQINIRFWSHYIVITWNWKLLNTSLRQTVHAVLYLSSCYRDLCWILI